jgi:hypothetical protein
LKTAPLYVTLDASGNGSVTFRAHKPLVAFIIGKVTVEMAPTSSGLATLYKNGTFLTSMPVAKLMEAYGPERLYTSEYVTGEIQNGPASTEVKFTFHYDEEPAKP